MVFSATDSSIVPNDNNGKVDTFLYDRQSGSTQCISCPGNGVRGNGDSFAIRILGDEQRVAFVSAASNLVVGDNNGHADLFIYDIPSQQLSRYDAPVSLYETVMSADGKWIAYSSNFGEISIQAVDEFELSTGQDLPYFFHESPGRLSEESGLGLIRGWICNPGHIEFQIDREPRQAILSGLSRVDTQATCGSSKNGYATLINYNLMGAGEHTIRLFVDGQLFSESLFTVTSFGLEFLTGLSKNVTVSDFPISGEQTQLSWSEAHQNFVLTPLIRPKSTQFPQAINLKFTERVPEVTGSYAVSGNGRYVAYPREEKLYLYDRELKVEKQVVPDSFELPVGGHRPAISDGGRYIAFTAIFKTSGIFEPYSFDSSYDVFLIDTQLQVVEKISFAADDPSITSLLNRRNLHISHNGRYVSYQTQVASSLSKVSLTVYDRLTQATTELSDNIYDSVMSTQTDLLAFWSESEGLSIYDLEAKQASLIAASQDYSFDRSSRFSNQGIGLSANGRWLSFGAYHPDGLYQIVLYDRQMKEFNWILRQIFFQHDSGGFERIRVSDDGRYITYNLVTIVGIGGFEGVYYDNVFVYDREQNLTTALLTDAEAELSFISFDWLQSDQSLVYYHQGSLFIKPVNQLFQENIFPHGFHESPVNFSAESGLGLIRGWVCDAKKVTMQIDNRPWVEVPYGIEREDTRSVCGDSNNGYAFLSNWNLLGPGKHRIRVLADNYLVGDETFTVTTLGQEFITGLNRTVPMVDFPFSGDRTTLKWSEPHQNFVISNYTPATR